ncbi:aspartyl/asparaginyl beta-hydroxylase domain-containing protein [bacterium]|nr:aspartyl/asparaginyl beta-hydroxylase domain-containing protein [bacterium]
MDAPEFWEDYLTEVPIYKSLIENYVQIRDEVLRYKENHDPFVDYPKYEVIDLETSAEADLYDHYWAVIPLSRLEGEAYDFIDMPGIENFPEFLAARIKHGREHCPTIVSVISTLESDNNLANVFVSRLVPGSVIRPHTGWVDDWMRLHLGLVCDPDCHIKVGTQQRTWQEGKIIAFKDGGPFPHSVIHNGTRERLILSVDVRLSYLKTFIHDL